MLSCWYSWSLSSGVWMSDVWHFFVNCSSLYDIDHVTGLARPVWLQVRVAVLLVWDLGRDFAHQLAFGMPDGDRNKFGLSYTKVLKQNLSYFKGLRSYLSCSINKKINVRTKKFSSRFLCYINQCKLSKMHQISTQIAQNEDRNDISVSKALWRELRSKSDSRQAGQPSNLVRLSSKNSLTWSPIIAANNNLPYVPTRDGYISSVVQW